MADLKISALPAITTLAGTEEFVVAAAGVTNKITAANVAVSFGAGATWTSSTPTLTASTTNPTLGTGSVAKGRYLQLGDLVIYAGEIVFGSSGMSGGSGTYKLSLPVALDTSRTDNIGQVQGFDATGTASIATAYVFDTTHACMRSHGGSGLWTQTVPFTWAASDRIDFLLMYEAA